jgi:hypothetical protein
LRAILATNRRLIETMNEQGRSMREISTLSRRAVLSFILLASASGIDRAAPAPAAGSDPGDVVSAIYKAAAGPGGKYDDGNSVFFDSAARKRFLSKNLQAELRAMEKRTPKGDEPDLDFDPVCACNDPSVEDLKITTDSQTDAQAAVIVTFRAHDEKEPIVLRYPLVKENGAWKVDDVISTGKDKWQVSKIVTGKCPNC